MSNFIRYLLLVGFSLMSIVCLSAQDPMRPPSWMFESSTVKESNVERLIVQQILISENRTLAVINDVVVSVGDTVAGAKVKKISRQWVKVVRGGRSMTLRIVPTTKEYIREN